MNTTTPPVSEKFLIFDSRNSDDFKTSTFSGYKRTEVRQKLILAMLESRLEEACFWTAELVCSGHFLDLWDLFLFFLGKHIHLGNPLVAIYLKNKYAVFRSIIHSEVFTQMHDLRNNSTLRELFAEIAATMTLSEKKQSWEEVHVIEVADIGQMTHHLRADRSDYAQGVFREGDPRELVIPLNELCFHLCQSRNMRAACFWLEWMAEFINLAKKRREPLFCQRRAEYADVEPKYRGDYVWLVWEALLAAASAEPEPVVGILVQTLFDLYRIRYSTSTLRKRKPLLYFAVSLLTETGTFLKRPVLDESGKEMVVIIRQSIHSVVYKEIKKSEVWEGVDEAEDAFSGKKHNLEVSARKLAILQEADSLLDPDSP